MHPLTTEAAADAGAEPTGVAAAGCWDACAVLAAGSVRATGTVLVAGWEELPHPTVVRQTASSATSVGIRARRMSFEDTIRFLSA